MNILYLSYWSINEGITKASVSPTINYLSKNYNIILVTIERDPFNNIKQKLPEGIIHVPVYAKFKFFEPLKILLEIRKLISRYNPKILIGRSAFAGFYLSIFKTKNNKLIIESFEPHHLYMTALNKWKAYDLKLYIYLFYHNICLKKADVIMPVSKNYLNLLKTKYPELRNKFELLPCVVDFNKFQFDLDKRKEYRSKLYIGENEILGIYVGKFGDIYWNFDEFLKIFNELSLRINKLKFLIITEQKHILNKKIPNVITKKVNHEEIPNYLSAADFAISCINSTNASKFCSPIKNGEFLFNNLPVITLPDIGDDSDLIEKHDLGIIIKEKSITKKEIAHLLNKISKRTKHINNMNFIKYRDYTYLKKLYDKILTMIENE